MMTHNPLYAASHAQNLAERAKNDKLAMAFTVMSVSLVGMMLLKEARELFRDKDPRGHFGDNQRGR